MTLKQKWYSIIFESDTKAGKTFDILLLVMILSSVIVVTLDSVSFIHVAYRPFFQVFEWIFTISFTFEYITRILVHPKPIRYVFSFWGLIDLISILPTYVGLFYGGYQYLLVVRILRLFRIFRIFKMVRFNRESQALLSSLKASLYKISIFFMALLFLVVIMGTVMYVVEGGESSDFNSIPQGIYWAVITITTVGYGDIVPQTVIGKFISAFSMIVGYSIIAIPTGIVTAEMSRKQKYRKICTQCNTSNNIRARYCNHCGSAFQDKVEAAEEVKKGKE